MSEKKTESGAQNKSEPKKLPHMPDAEAVFLDEAYQKARVILEYGSGGSTRLGSQLVGKYILSVENDRNWARTLRQEIAAAKPKSPVTVYHVDMGDTAAWGRLVDESNWRCYHRYSNAIWDEPFFRHPDLVLIDGRFRVACLMTVLLRIQQPVRVLFDDYIERPKYQQVEDIVRPRRVIGRMAEFHLEPGMVKPQDIGFIISRFFDVTLHKEGRISYGLTSEDLTEMNRVATGKQERPTP